MPTVLFVLLQSKISALKDGTIKLRERLLSNTDFFRTTINIDGEGRPENRANIGLWSALLVS